MQNSEAMLIGSKRNENAIDVGFKWVNTIKILGIYFSKNKCASEIDLNWKDKIKHIKQIIIKWEKRNLNLLGKICVIKSFLLSQFVYLLQAISLPEDVLKEINTILYRFLWRKRDCNKKAFEKVKRTVVNSEIKNGGINMIDIKTMQESFLCLWLIKFQMHMLKKPGLGFQRVFFIFLEETALALTQQWVRKPSKVCTY
jgi:hypothetical protein